MSGYDLHASFSTARLHLVWDTMSLIMREPQSPSTLWLLSVTGQSRLGPKLPTKVLNHWCQGYDLHVPSIAYGFLTARLRCMYSAEIHDHRACFGCHLVSVTKQSRSRPKLPTKVHANAMSVSWAWPIEGSLAYSYHSCFGRRASLGCRAAARKMHTDD